MRNEKKSLERLKREQNIKLQRLIQHAYENIPFYLQKFDQAGVRPGDIQTVDDLKKIPIITKDDFYAADPNDLIDRRIQDRSQLIPISTSGSSGKSLQFVVDNKYNQLRKAQFLRPYLSNGHGIFDKNIWFRARINSKKPFHQKLGLLREYQLKGGSNTADQIRKIQKIRPDIMRGYGSIFQLIAAKAQEDDIRLHSPRTIFTDSELLHKELRLKIERAFGTEVIDVYGTFETENIAYECNHHKGYHMAIDCSVIEFIKDGMPVKAGEIGEVVFTVLDNYTFPFIRYNIGDLASYSDQPCTCGRTFPLMEISSGRASDFAILRSGDKISANVLIGQLLYLEKFIQEFQIIQESLNLFTVQLIPTKQYHDEISQKLTTTLQAELQDATVNIRQVDNIAREKSGKWKAFKSLIRT
jgi:phenylacetate-CoA ligase